MKPRNLLGCALGVMGRCLRPFCTRRRGSPPSQPVTSSDSAAELPAGPTGTRRPSERDRRGSVDG